jgi:hypothetical protein
MANRIANFLNDSGPAKLLVQKAQLEVYGCKKQITINVPTRFATNFLVLRSVSDSSQALVQAVSSEAWSAPGGPGANRDGNGSKVRDILESTSPEGAFFWENVEHLIELLKPFSDAIHQLEADRPMLSQCHEVVVVLHQHVSAFVRKHRGKRDGAVVFRLQETFDGRYEAVAGGARVPINNAAYAAAYLLDPYFSVKDIQDGQVVWNPPEVSSARQDQAVALVQRMGGPEAARKMNKLILGGYPKSMSGFVEAVANAEETEAAEAAAAFATERSNKRKFAQMPSLSMRLNIWKRFGTKEFASLTKVVQRLLVCHATSCATERNWSLWGRVYTASRNALGIERGKKLITICANSRRANENDFAVSLAVVEGDIEL